MTDDHLPHPDEDDVEAYVLGTLDDESSRALEARLATSPALRQQMERARAVAWLLAESPAQLSPTPHLRARLLMEARQPSAPSFAKGLSPKPLQAMAPPRALRWSWLAVASLMLMIGVTGWGVAIYQTQAQRTVLEQQQARIEQYQSALQTLIAADRFWTMRGVPEQAPEALSTLALNRRHHQTVLVVTGFPILPTGKTYQVWVLQEGRQVPVGMFSPTDEGAEQALVIPSDLQGVTHAMITIEPATGSQQPTGQIVMDGDL